MGRLKAQKGISGALKDCTWLMQSQAQAHKVTGLRFHGWGCGLPLFQGTQGPASRLPCFPDIIERPLFPLNVPVKLLLKNPDLVSAASRERNSWLPLPA